MKKFGVLVREVLPGESPARQILSGPMFGQLPKPGTSLTVRSGGRESSLNYTGPVRLRRRGGDSDFAVLVEGPGTSLLREGAVVSDEGTRIREFTSSLRKPVPEVFATARFFLADGEAYGFVRVQENSLVAYLVDEGIPENADLWTRFRHLRTSDGFEVARDQLTLDADPPADHYASVTGAVRRRLAALSLTWAWTAPVARPFLHEEPR